MQLHIHLIYCQKTHFLSAELLEIDLVDAQTNVFIMATILDVLSKPKPVCMIVLPQRHRCIGQQFSKIRGGSMIFKGLANASDVQACIKGAN